jgi:hypothetical protein
MTTHTPDCLRQQEAQKQRQREYDAQWPKWCRKCNGTGMLTWYENQAPLGSGYNWPEQFEEPCETCIGGNRCSRCGHKQGKNWNDTVTPCAVCGFVPMVSEGRPTDYECDCWEREVDDVIERAERSWKAWEEA